MSSEKICCACKIVSMNIAYDAVSQKINKQVIIMCNKVINIMLMTTLAITATVAAGSVAAAKKILKLVFARPKVTYEKLQKIPFKELSQSAALSRLAYVDPVDVKSESQKYPNVGADFIADQTFYDGNPIADTQAYIWWHPEIKTVYICFRGTSSLKDAESDLDVRYHVFDLDGASNKIRVHSGFYIQVMAVYDNIRKDLQSRILDFDTIVLAAHSLGASCSTLAAAELVKDFPDKDIHCHTFGSPRVGNEEFVKWFNSHVKSNWRVFNEQDPVSMVPISARFCHVDNGICIDDDGNIKEAKKDYPWWVRIFASLPNVDYGAPIKDHDLGLYISRLSSFVRP